LRKGGSYVCVPRLLSLSKKLLPTSWEAVFGSYLIVYVRIILTDFGQTVWDLYHGNGIIGISLPETIPVYFIFPERSDAQMPEKLKIRKFTPTDTEAVIRVWTECGLVVPQNDPRRDIELKMAFQPDLFLVGESEGQVVAAVMAGYDGHRGWLNYLGVKPSCQRRGYGREMVLAAMEILKNLGCPKLNLQIRESNQQVIQFYEKLGFKRDPVIGMGYRF
jgi:ribosomal protein S18 acetylase RimI-like enzyme